LSRGQNAISADFIIPDCAALRKAKTPKGQNGARRGAFALMVDGREYRGDFALLVAGRGALWQFVPRASRLILYIKEAKFRENRLPRRRQPKIRRNHPANRLILRYFPALG